MDGAIHGNTYKKLFQHLHTETENKEKQNIPSGWWEKTKSSKKPYKTAVLQHIKGLLYLSGRSHGNSFRDEYQDEEELEQHRTDKSANVNAILESTDKTGKST